MRKTEQIETDEILGWTVSRNTARVKGYGALYRKKGRNYVWRGKIVPNAVEQRMITGFPDMEGDILLYKRGAMTGNNKEHYPIRLDDGRYAFVLGSIQHVLRGALDRYGIRMNQPEQQLMFDLWAQEHLLDYDRLPASGHTSIFKTRAQYVWLLETFFSRGEYNDDYYEYSEGEYDDVEVGIRAAYCVWQNGEIIRWMRAGCNVHPKI